MVTWNANQTHSSPTEHRPPRSSRLDPPGDIVLIDRTAKSHHYGLVLAGVPYLRRHPLPQHAIYMPCQGTTAARWTRRDTALPACCSPTARLTAWCTTQDGVRRSKPDIPFVGRGVVCLRRRFGPGGGP